VPAGLAGLLVAYVVALMPIHQATGHYIASLGASDSDTALAEIQSAQDLDPALLLYPVHEAYILGLLAQDDASIRPTALQAYEDVLQQEDTWVMGWLNMAALLEAAGDIDGALAALESAAQFDATGAAWLHWARLSEAHARSSDEAIIEAYTESIVEELPLASFWDQTPLRQQAVERFAAEQEADIQYRIWQAHDPARLADIVPQNPQSAGEYWVIGQWALSQGDAQAAYEAFTQAIAADKSVSDYYVSRAMTYSSLTPGADRDLVQAQWVGESSISPYALRAEWTTDANQRLDYLLDAVPRARTQQFFSFIVYDRTGSLDTFPQMRLPGPGDAALQPAFDALTLLEAAGQDRTARALWR
jgi:tetratricopeptide (TPR) repeat protein